MSPREPTEWMREQHPDQGEFRNGLAVLEAKSALAGEATARATRFLAFATFALVVATIAAVVVAAVA